MFFIYIFNIYISNMSDFSLEICIIGDSSVGKTTFSYLLTTSKFNYKSTPTIGLEFAAKYFKYELNDKFYNFKWNIWDTAGQECYKSLVSSYYRKGTVFLLLFDLSSNDSFISISYWLDEIIKNNNGTKFIYLIGNKSDKTHKVSGHEIKKFIDTNNLKYFELSLKNKDNFNQLIDKINLDIIQYVDDLTIMKSDKEKLGFKFLHQFENIKNLNLSKERENCYVNSCCNIS